MYRHLSLTLWLTLAAPALAASAPASEYPRSEEDRLVLEQRDTYGVVTELSPASHTMTVRKPGGETVTFGTVSLDPNVSVGSTVRLRHEQDAGVARDVELVDPGHDEGAITEIDRDKHAFSIRQLGGEVVEYEVGDLAFDTSSIRIGERVEITHANGTALFVSSPVVRSDADQAGVVHIGVQDPRGEMAARYTSLTLVPDAVATDAP